MHTAAPIRGGCFLFEKAVEYTAYMSRLIFDIETAGENFDSLDETTQSVLTQWIKKEADSEEAYRAGLAELKDGLGFSPLTGEIVAIGMYDYDRDRGAVCYRAPGEKNEDFEEENISFKQMTEKGMLEHFWKAATHYDEFITFNGRQFDAPFLMVRSAIHKIRPTQDLMEGRYLYQQRKCRHVDLYDQLTFYGATRKKGGLHLWARAFGIKSPKADGVTGDDVARLFKEKKFKEIARYNVGDLHATKELYRAWEDYLRL